MPEGAPGGPGPEETGELPSLSEVEAPRPAEEEPRRRRWWPFGRRPEQARPAPPEPTGPREELAEREAELEAIKRRTERQGGEPIGGLERIKELAASTNPEDLVHLMTIITAEQFREMKLEEKHPGRLGKLGKIVAGERDFDVTPDGQIRHNAWRELSRKALTTIFNKKTLLMAGTLGVVGVLTGGLAYPAAAALFGSIGGRGLAEGLEYLYGHERGRRQKIIEAQMAQWGQLREMALQAIEEGVDPAEKARLYTEIINGFHSQSEQVTAAEERLGETKKMWNRRREIFSAVGGAVGAAGGLWLGLKGLTNMGIFDLDRDGFFHAVRNINHVWHFGYGQGEAAAGTVQHIGSAAFHQVGPGAETIMARTAAQIAAVFAGLGLATAWKGKEAGEMDEILAEEQDARRQEMLGQVPQVPEASPPPPTSEEVLVTNQERYLAISREQGKGMPDVGQIWLLSEIHPDTSEKYVVAYRIRNLDWASGIAMVDQLDSHDYSKVLAADQQLGIEDLLRRGRELVEDWLLTVQDGDEIEIDQDVIIDRSDPKAPKVEAGKYKFKKLEQKPGQAELRREGKRKPIVDILDLAMAGARPVEQARERKPAKMPKQNEIWALKQGETAPGGLPSRVIIADVEDNVIYLLDASNNQPIDTTIEDVNQFVSAFRKIGKKSGGGGGGRQQQRQRQNE